MSPRRFAGLAVAAVALLAGSSVTVDDPADAATDDGAADARPTDDATRSRPADEDAGTGPAPGVSDDTVVRTESGLVRGRASAGHVTWSGIPYAAPPVGDRRWAPPRRAASWTGVRDATTPASPCAQPGDGPDGVVGQEDCLHLDVTTPRREARRPRLPVMVWIHGGGFVSGAGSHYDGAQLAEGGDVVVVTLNYRLGPLGFLSSTALDRHDQQSGNFGLQDQQAALRWVRRNVARFGGDPGNVTVFGQSSGSLSVCAHLAAPGSRELLHKAIAQSGACAKLVTKPVADQRGEEAAAALGCAAADDVAGCLRDRPVADVLSKLAGQAPLTGEMRDRPWLPVAGTAVLPSQPIEALARGSAAEIPLLVGSTRDEMRPFVGFRYDANGRPLTVPEYETLITEAFGPDAGEVLARYPVNGYPSPALALSTVLTDWGGGIGACPVLRTAQVASRHGPVFAYELTEDSDQVFQGFPLGAYHGWDLPYLWGDDLAIPGSTYPDLTPDQQVLSQQMVRYWTTFARTGDPNSPGSVPWPRARPDSDTVLSLAAGAGGIVPAPFAGPHHCGFWSDRDQRW